MGDTLPAVNRQEIAVAPAKQQYFYGGEDAILRSQDPVLEKEARGRLATYRDLERDPKVFAVLQKRYDMTAEAPMIVRPGLRRGASTSRADRKAADMLTAHVDAMGVAVDDDVAWAHAEFASDFEGAMYGLLDAILMGYAVGEIIWDKDGGEVYASEIRIRKQERFRVDGLHRWRLMDDEFGLKGRLLPPRKFLFYTFGSYTDPYGLGLGYRLYWPVWFKRQDMSFWLRMLDKFGGPTVKGKYPPNTPPTGANSQATLLSAAQSVQTEGAVVIPDGMDLELMQAVMTAAQQGFEQLGRFLDGQISQATLGVTLTSDVQGTGARAATETHRAEQLSFGKRDAAFLMRFLTRRLSRWTTDFNGGPAVTAPLFVKMFPDLAGLREQAAVDQTVNQGSGYRRTLESVNKIYGAGEPAFEPDPSRKAAPATTPASEQEPAQTPSQEEDDSNE